jgi:hypothetical protein
MNNQKPSIEEIANRKAQEKVDFLGHLLVYIVVNLFLFAINFFSSFGRWWFVWPLFGWGIGLFFHGLGVFVLDGTLANAKEAFYNQELERLKKQK